MLHKNECCQPPLLRTPKTFNLAINEVTLVLVINLIINQFQIDSIIYSLRLIYYIETDWWVIFILTTVEDTTLCVAPSRWPT